MIPLRIAIKNEAIYFQAKMKDIEKNESKAADRIKQSYQKENARMFYIIFAYSLMDFLIILNLTNN